VLRERRRDELGSDHNGFFSQMASSLTRGNGVKEWARKPGGIVWIYSVRTMNYRRAYSQSFRYARPISQSHTLISLAPNHAHPFPGTHHGQLSKYPPTSHFSGLTCHTASCISVPVTNWYQLMPKSRNWMPARKAMRFGKASFVESNTGRKCVEKR
jgi:hypothetical protein